MYNSPLLSSINFVLLNLFNSYFVSFTFAQLLKLYCFSVSLSLSLFIAGVLSGRIVL